ncbi:hypothetical protein KIPB_003074 [Kipferlia bialata]|uniref:PH domain-containing protein n=1 Tax=Kipferlia bialata TaxID=797122 RepID=A0A9K3CSU5_9EUKA|nr:hypothetical protein KIPB_003074 [Kipferlia bialata]|eukprot:g3074.t1
MCISPPPPLWPRFFTKAVRSPFETKWVVLHNTRFAPDGDLQSTEPDLKEFHPVLYVYSSRAHTKPSHMCSLGECFAFPAEQLLTNHAQDADGHRSKDHGKRGSMYKYIFGIFFLSERCYFFKTSTAAEMARWIAVINVAAPPMDINLYRTLCSIARASSSDELDSVQKLHNSFSLKPQERLVAVASSPKVTVYLTDNHVCVSEPATKRDGGKHPFLLTTGAEGAEAEGGDGSTLQTSVKMGSSSAMGQGGLVMSSLMTTSRDIPFELTLNGQVDRAHHGKHSDDDREEEWEGDDGQDEDVLEAMKHTVGLEVPRTIQAYALLQLIEDLRFLSGLGEAGLKMLSDLEALPDLPESALECLPPSLSDAFNTNYSSSEHLITFKKHAQTHRPLPPCHVASMQCFSRFQTSLEILNISNTSLPMRWLPTTAIISKRYHAYRGSKASGETRPVDCYLNLYSADNMGSSQSARFGPNTWVPIMASRLCNASVTHAPRRGKKAKKAAGALPAGDSPAPVKAADANLWSDSQQRVIQEYVESICSEGRSIERMIILYKASERSSPSLQILHVPPSIPMEGFMAVAEQLRGAIRDPLSETAVKDLTERHLASVSALKSFYSQSDFRARFKPFKLPVTEARQFSFPGCTLIHEIRGKGKRYIPGGRLNVTQHHLAFRGHNADLNVDIHEVIPLGKGVKVERLSDTSIHVFGDRQRHMSSLEKNRIGVDDDDGMDFGVTGDYSEDEEEGGSLVKAATVSFSTTFDLGEGHELWADYILQISEDLSGEVPPSVLEIPNGNGSRALVDASPTNSSPISEAGADGAHGDSGVDAVGTEGSLGAEGMDAPVASAESGDAPMVLFSRLLEGGATRATMVKCSESVLAEGRTDNTDDVEGATVVVKHRCMFIVDPTPYSASNTREQDPDRSRVYAAYDLALSYVKEVKRTDTETRVRLLTVGMDTSRVALCHKAKRWMPYMVDTAIQAGKAVSPDTATGAFIKHVSQGNVVDVLLTFSNSSSKFDCDAFVSTLRRQRWTAPDDHGFERQLKDTYDKSMSVEGRLTELLAGIGISSGQYVAPSVKCQCSLDALKPLVLSENGQLPPETEAFGPFQGSLVLTRDKMVFVTLQSRLTIYVLIPYSDVVTLGDPPISISHGARDRQKERSRQTRRMRRKLLRGVKKAQGGGHPKDQGDVEEEVAEGGQDRKAYPECVTLGVSSTTFTGAISGLDSSACGMYEVQTSGTSVYEPCAVRFYKLGPDHLVHSTNMADLVFHAHRLPPLSLSRGNPSSICLRLRTSARDGTLAAGVQVLIRRLDRDRSGASSRFPFTDSVFVCLSGSTLFLYRDSSSPFPFGTVRVEAGEGADGEVLPPASVVTISDRGFTDEDSDSEQDVGEDPDFSCSDSDGPEEEAPALPDSHCLMLWFNAAKPLDVNLPDEAEGYAKYSLVSQQQKKGAHRMKQDADEEHFIVIRTVVPEREQKTLTRWAKELNDCVVTQQTSLLALAKRAFRPPLTAKTCSVVTRPILEFFFSFSAASTYRPGRFTRQARLRVQKVVGSGTQVQGDTMLVSVMPTLREARFTSFYANQIVDVCQDGAEGELVSIQYVSKDDIRHTLVLEPDLSPDMPFVGPDKVKQLPRPKQRVREIVKVLLYLTWQSDLPKGE